MSSVTYKNQPAIDTSGGTVPLAGTEHVYTVNKVLWPQAVEHYLGERLIGTTLHVCCGKSRLGDIRLDLHESDIDIRADAAYLPFVDQSFDTVLIDPPYNGIFSWQHTMLNELHRIAKKRIIHQHWYSPVDKYGRFKKSHLFRLSDTAIIPTIDRSSVLLLVNDPTGQYYTTIDEDSQAFDLTELTYWQPRTYFGRVQLISIMDKL